MAIHSGTATVIFHAPISPRDFASHKDLAEAVRARIETPLRSEGVSAGQS
jgi:hypothetical protein